MEFRGKNLRKTIGSAVSGASAETNARRRACAQIWVKVSDIERDLARFNQGLEELEAEFRNTQIRQLIDAAELAEDIAAVVIPMFGRARKVVRILQALGRLARGGRIADVISELRDLINILTDIESGLDNLNSIIRANQDLATLDAKMRRLSNQSQALRNAGQILERESARLRCDDLPEEEEQGDGGFVGVSFGKKK